MRPCLRSAALAFERRDTLQTVGSAIGQQLDKLRDRLPTRSAAVGNVREELVVRALHCLARARLTPEEDLVAYLRLTGFSPGRRTYTREVWASDVEFLITRQGEEDLGPVLDEEGQPVIPERRLVRGTRRVMMTFEDIAAAVRREVKWVRNRWNSAAAKLQAAEFNSEAEAATEAAAAK